MTPHLQQSLHAAENLLSQEGQEQLASIIELFTAQYQDNSADVFTDSEIALVEHSFNEPFVAASAKEVRSMFVLDDL